MLPSNLESPEGRDSPKTDRSEKAETGYFSSSLSSISNQLGSLDDMMPTESPTFGTVSFSESEAFEQNRVLNLFSGEKGNNEMRSRSDPMPSTIPSDKSNHSQSAEVQSIEPQWSSNSEPNLASANLSQLTEQKRATSTQEVLKADEGKTRKGSSESSDRSPVGSPFEQTAFPHQRTGAQKGFAQRPFVPQSPVALVVPQPKQKHVSHFFDFFVVGIIGYEVISILHSVQTSDLLR